MTSSLPLWWPAPAKSDPNSPGLWTELKSALDAQAYLPVRAQGIVSKEMKDGSGRHFILKNGKTHTYARLAPEEFWLWEQMDGSKTVQNLVMAYFLQHKAFGFGAIVSLLDRLRANHMLDEKPPRLYADLAAGIQSQSLFYKLTLGARAAFTREFTIRNLDKHLERIHRNGGWLLFTLPLQILYLLCATVGLYLFFVLTSDPSYKILSLESPLQLGALAYLPLVIHEFGHAITAKHIGCEVYKGGIMLYYGMPAVFVDTTDVWLFGKRARLAVTWAGPYTGYIIGGGLASIVYFAPHLSPQTAQAMLQVASSAIFITTLNVLPLLKLDGYYLLSDALEMPRLRERSMEFITRSARGKFLKKEKWTREEKIFLVFGILAFLSTFYFAWAGLRFWDRQSVASVSELLHLEGSWSDLTFDVFILLLAASSIFFSLYLLIGQVKPAIRWLRARGLLSTPLRAALVIVISALALTLLPRTLLPSLAAGLTPLIGILAFGASAWRFLADFLSMRGSVHRWMWLAACLGASLSMFGFLDSLDFTIHGYTQVARGAGAALLLFSLTLAGRLLGGLRGSWRFVSLFLWLAATLSAILSLFLPTAAFHWHVLAGLLAFGIALHWDMRPAASPAPPVEVEATASARARLLAAFTEIRNSILSELALDFGALTRQRVERGEYRPRRRGGVGEANFNRSQANLTPDDYGNALALNLEELISGVECVGGSKYAWRSLAYGFDKLAWELREIAEDHLLKYVQHSQGLSAALAVERNDLGILLRSVPLFASLTGESLAFLERKFAPLHFERGDDVVRAGEAGDMFYVIRAGRAEVLSADGEQLNTLGRGDFFGEAALLSGAKRNATVRALTPLQAMALGKSHFDRILRANVEFDEKSRRDWSRLRLLRQIPIFEQFEGLDLKMLAAQMQEVNLPQGSVVFEQGARGDCFYVIESGKVSVQIDGQERAVLSAGEYFGEIALMMDSPRTATVSALQPTVLLQLDAEDFKELLQNSSGLKQAIERASSRRILVDSRSAAIQPG